MNNRHVQLMSAASATGADCEWPGGWGVVFVEGDFTGGGNITIETKGPQGTYIDTGLTAFAAAGSGAFLLPPGTIRAKLNGAVTSIYARAVQVTRY